MEKYTISELAEFWGLTWQGANKRVKHLLNETNSDGLIQKFKEVENGKEVSKILIDSNLRDGFLNPVETKIKLDETGIKPIELGIKQLSPEFIESAINELIHTKNQLIEYAADAKQVPLLKIIEQNKDEEINRLRAENKQLQEKLNKRWWIW